MKKKRYLLISNFYKFWKSKLFVLMRTVLFLITISISQTFALNTYSQGRLNLSLEGETILKVLEKIEDQSDYYFMFDATVVDLNSKIDIDCKNQSITEVLDEIFQNTGIIYTIAERQIALRSENLNQSFQQQKTITGKITDSSGAPLPGVTVVIKGTTQGTITDMDGNYSIANVPGDAALVFSFVGMKTQEISVSGKTTVDVALAEDAIGIEEVIAIGYATIKKSDLTGSVGSLDNESLTVKGTTSPMEALQGQLAGVNIVATTGRTGAEYAIKIRGDNSLRGGDPLYVVDGIFTDNIQFLNPQDIERLDVLKDASSTAIYGSRGSNGVIIVTTKQAANVKDQKPVISYDGYYGVRTPSHLPDLMNGDQYWEYRQNAYLGPEFNKGKDITLPQYDQAWLDSRTSYGASEVLKNNIDNKNYTDWLDLVANNGSQQNHSLSISGKSANNISYLFGLGYQKEDGVFINEWYDRYNFKASVNHKISDKWTAGTNVILAITEQELGGGEQGWEMREAFIMPPVVTPYIPEGYENAGDYSLRPAQSYGMGITASLNPMITRTESRDNDRQLYVLGNIYLQYSPIKGLTLKSTLSTRVNSQRRGTFEGSKSQTRNLRDPAADLTKNQSLSYTWDNQAVYEKIVGDHNFNFMVLHSLDYFNNEGSYIAVENLPFESLWHNLGSAPDIIEVGSSYRKITLASVLGRLNYSYKNKYLLTASFRTDGSSKLAEGHKWSIFPSAALAWRISEEDFLQGAEKLSNLKFRVSYGYTGNNNISPYSTLTYVSSQRYYEFGGVSANGFAPSNIANSSLTWEKTRELNVGLDFGFFSNRISGSIDVYDKLSNELLLPSKLPVETGWGSVMANIGSVSNKGVELALNTVNIDTKNITWETSFTFSKNINKIEELYGTDEDDIGNLWFIGEPVNVNYTYVFDGIWKADEAELAAVYGQREGQARVKDLDESDAIEADKDRTIIGTPDPSWAGSFATTVRYKNFDLNASLYTQQGVQVRSDFHFFYTRMKDRWRNKLDINYYMPDNNVTGFRDSDEYPTPKAEGTYWDKVGYYKDVSFVKVKNISLGYTFSSELLKSTDIKSLRLYVNVLNPFIFTKYDGYDPEWAASRFGGGVSTTTYQFGVNVKF